MNTCVNLINQVHIIATCMVKKPKGCTYGDGQAFEEWTNFGQSVLKVS